MKTIKTLFIMAAMILVLGCEEGAQEPPIGTAGAGNAGAGNAGAGNGGGSSGGPGQALFTQFCASCHGADGSGGGVYSDSIRNQSDMRDIVQNGDGAMPGFPNLSSADVLSIEAFLNGTEMSTGGGAGGTGDPYARLCSGCHGASGEGTPLGPQIQSPVYGYADWVTRNGRSGVGFSGAMPAYDRQVLSDDALDSILERLAQAPKPTTDQDTYLRYCGNCHGPTGGGGPTREGIRDELDELVETTREGEGGHRYGARGDYMPAWSSGEISNSQMSAIRRFLGGGSGGGDVDGDSDEDSDEGSDED